MLDMLRRSAHTWTEIAGTSAILVLARANVFSAVRPHTSLLDDLVGQAADRVVPLPDPR